MGFPIAVVGILLARTVLVFFLFKIKGDIQSTGEASAISPLPNPMKVKATFVVFLTMTLGWIFLPLLFPSIPNLEMIVSICGGAALLASRCLHLQDLRRTSWGVLVLFGGGLALSGAVQSSGAAGSLHHVFQNLASAP